MDIVKLAFNILFSTKYDIKTATIILEVVGYLSIYIDRLSSGPTS
jgi:hypothetical protein